jgi:DNA-binding HxlR family transcriptional regulator
VEYSLTDKGKALLPIIDMMKDWGLDNIINKQKEVANSGLYK